MCPLPDPGTVFDHCCRVDQRCATDKSFGIDNSPGHHDAYRPQRGAGREKRTRIGKDSKGDSATGRFIGDGQPACIIPDRNDQFGSLRRICKQFLFGHIDDRDAQYFVDMAKCRVAKTDNVPSRAAGHIGANTAMDAGTNDHQVSWVVCRI